MGLAKDAKSRLGPTFCMVLDTIWELLGGYLAFS